MVDTKILVHNQQLINEDGTPTEYALSRALAQQTFNEGLDTSVATNTAAIVVNTAAITVNTSAIATNTAAIAAIPSLTSPVIATFPILLNVTSDTALLAEDGTEGMCLSSLGTTTASALRGIFKTAFASNLTYTAKIGFVAINASDRLGFFLRDSTSGRIVTFARRSNVITVSNWNSSTSFSGDIKSGSVDSSAGPVWFRVVDNGTNFTFRLSAGGGAYQTLYTASRTSWLAAPDQIGFGIEDDVVDALLHMAILHYEET
ncbi:MAG: hypothetical protein V3T39_08435 [Gammaproteobacteria bacterium]